MKVKRLVALLLVLAMTFMTVACGENKETTATEESAGGEAAEEIEKAEETEEIEERESYTVGFVAMAWDIAFYKYVRDGFRMSMREGDECLYYAYDSDLNKEISVIEDLIAKQVDAIVCNTYDIEGLRPVLTECKEAGIPVFIYDKATDDEELVVTQVLTDDTEMGYVTAKATIEAMDGQKGLVTTFTCPGSIATEQRVDGVLKACAEYPDIEVVENLPQIKDYADTEGHVVSFDACLQKNPDLAAFVGLNENTTLTFISCAETAGMQDQLTIVTVDATAAMQELLTEGKIVGMIDQRAYGIGEQLAETMYKYLDGETDIEPYQYVPVQLVTKDNYDEWLEENNSYMERAAALGE